MESMVYPLLDEAFKEAGWFKFENEPLYFKSGEDHLFFEIVWNTFDYIQSLEGFLKTERVNKKDVIEYFLSSGSKNVTAYLTYAHLAGCTADMYFLKDKDKFEYWKDVYEKLSNKKYI